MTFCIVSYVEHHWHNNQYYAYAPYVTEMNIWLQYVDKVIIVAPLSVNKPSVIETSYQHNNIEFIEVEKFSLLSIREVFKTIWVAPSIVIKLFKVFQKSNHIHLRCPGNMGLLGALVQIAFPKKQKTAKYAGNWDPQSEQPITYVLQKKILSNTFFTKNMRVLVYGNWKNATKNIYPFYTATYTESEKQPLPELTFQNPLKFLFVGTLSKGKQPLYALQLVQNLLKKGYAVSLELFGEGNERANLERYIVENNLENYVFLRGNKSKDFLKQKYQESHFTLLPSKSEGWPKAVAEAMFWGSLPVATPISCVANMLGNGSRGIVLSLNLEADTQQIIDLIQNNAVYARKRKEAINWSRQYTIDTFETEIKKLVCE